MVTPSDSDYFKCRRFSSTVSVWIHDDSSRRSRVQFCAFVPRGACAFVLWDACGLKNGFGSGSLLFQEFRRRREEKAWKWRRIKTNLAVVIFMLRVMTYIVFYKLFSNWICVVRCVSREVWSDTLSFFSFFFSIHADLAYGRPAVNKNSSQHLWAGMHLFFSG